MVPVTSLCSRLAAIFLAIALWLPPEPASAQNVINYAADGRAAAKACTGFLAGMPPTTSLGQSGFARTKSIKRVTAYKKKANATALAAYFMFTTTTKRNDAAYRRCNFILGLATSGEINAVLKAIRAEFKAKGYRRSVGKNAVGNDVEYWTGQAGTYKLLFFNHGGAVQFEVAPK